MKAFITVLMMLTTCLVLAQGAALPQWWWKNLSKIFNNSQSSSKMMKVNDRTAASHRHGDIEIKAVAAVDFYMLADLQDDTTVEAEASGYVEDILDEEQLSKQVHHINTTAKLTSTGKHDKPENSSKLYEHVEYIVVEGTSSGEQAVDILGVDDTLATDGGYHDKNTVKEEELSGDTVDHSGETDDKIPNHQYGSNAMDNYSGENSEEQENDTEESDEAEDAIEEFSVNYSPPKQAVDSVVDENTSNQNPDHVMDPSENHNTLHSQSSNPDVGDQFDYSNIAVNNKMEVDLDSSGENSVGDEKEDINTSITSGDESDLVESHISGSETSREMGTSERAHHHDSEVEHDDDDDDEDDDDEDDDDVSGEESSGDLEEDVVHDLIYDAIHTSDDFVDVVHHSVNPPALSEEGTSDVESSDDTDTAEKHVVETDTTEVQWDDVREGRSSYTHIRK